jgi:hypothetical protein
LHAIGKFRAAGAQGNSANQPAYAFESQFERLNPSAVGKLLGQRWTGGEIEGSGNVDLSGYTGADLATSASGTLHFEWRHGSVGVEPARDAVGPSDEGAAAEIPAALARFDSWTADAAIAKGAITLGQNHVQRGAHRSTITASATLTDPGKVTFSAPKETQAAKR